MATLSATLTSLADDRSFQRQADEGVMRLLPRALFLLALAAAPAVAQPAPDGPVEPDRPDVTNGTHIVDVGLLQVEMGGVLGRPVSAERTFASPLTARLGLLEWLEARIGTDGLLIDSVNGVRQAGIGNVQLGAKSWVLDS